MFAYSKATTASVSSMVYNPIHCLQEEDTDVVESRDLKAQRQFSIHSNTTVCK